MESKLDAAKRSSSGVLSRLTLKGNCGRSWLLKVAVLFGLLSLPGVSSSISTCLAAIFALSAASNIHAIDELLLPSDTVNNQHCNGGMWESGNCPNSFTRIVEGY